MWDVFIYENFHTIMFSDYISCCGSIISQQFNVIENNFLKTDCCRVHSENCLWMAKIKFIKSVVRIPKRKIDDVRMAVKLNKRKIIIIYWLNSFQTIMVYCQLERTVNRSFKMLPLLEYLCIVGLSIQRKRGWNLNLHKMCVRVWNKIKFIFTIDCGKAKLLLPSSWRIFCTTRSK